MGLMGVGTAAELVEMHVTCQRKQSKISINAVTIHNRDDLLPRPADADEDLPTERSSSYTSSPDLM
jgi:hypothetical protein